MCKSVVLLIVAGVLGLLSVTPGLAQERAAPTVYLEVLADRADATYAVGQPIVFRVSAWTCTVAGNTARQAENATPVAGVALVYTITAERKMIVDGVTNGHEGPRWDQDAFIRRHLDRER